MHAPLGTSRQQKCCRLPRVGQAAPKAEIAQRCKEMNWRNDGKHGAVFTSCAEDLRSWLCRMSPQCGPGQEVLVPLGGNLLFFPLAALANPPAERTEAPAPCRQPLQAQPSPAAAAPADGARAGAGPAVCILLSSCVRQHPQRTPVASQGAREGREVPGPEDAQGLTGQRVPPRHCSQAQTNGQCHITCTRPRCPQEPLS